MNNDKESIYKDLAAQFVPFTKLLSIPIEENGEAMMDMERYGLLIDHSYSKLAPSTGEKLILRSGVCERLVQAEKLLQQLKPGYRLVNIYAYRSMGIQRTNFERMKRELGYGDRTDEEAYENTHHFIAVPDVAGHPTGGAIDLLIVDEMGKSLDFGTGMHALEKDSYVFCPFISDEATANRALLRIVMMKAGFAPYDGEWWHFSYGDREWAGYYDAPKAIYSQLDHDPRWEA